MKRTFDFFISLVGLIILSPLLLLFMILIWLQDFSSPFYVAPRIGKNGTNFKMVKLRSMITKADTIGVDSTAVDDSRITWVGHLIRRYKIDELSQLWNVLCGHMSLVGPRPNVQRGVELYTAKERQLLTVKPGITDFASIVFSDEGDILAGSDNPDLKYDQIIRPWKSRLGLFYIEKHSFLIDIKIIYLTLIAITSRPIALKGVQKILRQLDADPRLVKVSGRKTPLSPGSPPGVERNMDTGGAAI